MADVTTKSDLVAGFRRLRPVVHEWLARDLTGPPLEYTQAYADLMFAYGFARLGRRNDSATLVADATHSLSNSANELHSWLLRMFRYRIDESLAGKPNSSTFPEDILPTVPERMGRNDPIMREVYAASVLQSKSRILDPFGTVDPYAGWTSTQDLVKRRVYELSFLRDSRQIADHAWAMLDDAAKLDPLKKAGVWQQVLPLAARAGHELMARLLLEVPSIVFESLGPRSTANSLTRDLQGLITSAIDQAAALPDGEIFPPLIDSALAVIRAAQDAQSRTRLLGEIGWACLRWFRRLGEFDGASDFLLTTREWWPGTAWDRPNGRLRDTEEFVVFAATAEAALRSFVDQPQAGNILDAVVRASTANRLSANGLRLAFSGAACAMALWPTAVAFEKVVDLVRRVNRVSNTWNTAAYYSRFHLQMAESIVLAFPEVRGI